MDHKANILLVEDNPANLLALESVLTDLGHNLIRARSGEEALRHLPNHDFALILLDVNLPGISGFETARIIRQHERSASTPIVFLTGLESSDIQIQEGYELGAVDFLLKPYAGNVLRWKVSSLVDLYLKSQALGHMEVVQGINQRLEDALALLQELYAISREIGKASTARAMLEILLSSHVLQDACAGVILVFDPIEGNQSPTSGHIEGFWHCDPSVPDLTGRSYSLTNYDQTEFVEPGKIVTVEDVDNDPKVTDRERPIFAVLRSRSFIRFPLLANGRRFGTLAIHWDRVHRFDQDTIRHIQGLVDQIAADIHNLLIIRSEAAARLAAENANQTRLRFLAMISHELRTPLTSIKGFVTTLRQPDMTWGAETTAEFLEIIEHETDNLTNLVSQLLDMSLLEAGHFSMKQAPVRLDEVVSGVMPQLLFIGANHTVEIDISPDLPSVNVDSQRVGQVISNLVNNACKYSPANSRVEVRAYQTEGFIQVDVSDEGPGIPQDEYKTIFESFYQASNHPLDVKGIGLGLSVAKGIIEAHGGKIWIDEKTIVGTVMSFTLPILSS